MEDKPFTADIACSSCGRANADAHVNSSCGGCGVPLTGDVFNVQLRQVQEALEQLKRAAANPPKSFTTVNGIGTALLDCRARPDGTFDATRWFVIAFVPIAPLGEYVIRPVGEHSGGGYERQSFEIVGRGRLRGARILRTYLMGLAAVAVPVVAFYFGDTTFRVLGNALGFVVTASSLVWLGYMLLQIKDTGDAYRGRRA